MFNCTYMTPGCEAEDAGMRTRNVDSYEHRISLPFCSTDFPVYTLELTQHSSVKPTMRVLQSHACADCESVMGRDWLKGRTASIDDV